MIQCCPSGKFHTIAFCWYKCFTIWFCLTTFVFIYQQLCIQKDVRRQTLIISTLKVGVMRERELATFSHASETVPRSSKPRSTFFHPIHFRSVLTL